MDLHHSIVVFCDGACSGNPGPGGWGVIIATPDGQVHELGGRNPVTTNNQMELTAAIRALDHLKHASGEVYLHTDSTYVIQGITKWIFGWMKRGWKTAEGNDVVNRDLWETLLSKLQARSKADKVSWRYVRGHAGIPGNDRADAIAVAFAQNEHPSLYKGPLIKYGVALYDIPENSAEIPAMKPKGTKKAAAFSYLSLIGDIPYRHATWAECERRVKGKPGAKFKKTSSAEDEASVLKSWGVDPTKLKP